MSLSSNLAKKELYYIDKRNLFFIEISLKVYLCGLILAHLVREIVYIYTATKRAIQSTTFTSLRIGALSVKSTAALIKH